MTDYEQVGRGCGAAVVLAALVILVAGLLGLAVKVFIAVAT